MQGYDKKTLIGNWYEERWAPEQQAVKYRDERIKREKENSISFLGQTGNLVMPSVKRVHKWDTSGIISDDGYRELNTTNKTEIQHPSQHNPPNRKPKLLLSSKNIDKLTRYERPIQGPQSGFGAVLVRHGQVEKQTFFETNNALFFGKPDVKPPEDKFT